MNNYAKELAKDVLRFYNIDFAESESSITVFFFNKKKMDIDPALFSSWEDVLCEMLFTMEESNKDTFEEIGEHVWTDEEIQYVKSIKKGGFPIICKLIKAFRAWCQTVEDAKYEK